MRRIINTPTGEPSVFITKDKQRVRQHGDAVYLKNDDTFEVEIFNPLQKTVLAKIKLNGITISATGLIIKPGQRVFLERYFDQPKKFKFETYEVDGSDETIKAIALNGLLEVQFYLEQEVYHSWDYNNATIWTTTGPYSQPQPISYRSGGTSVGTRGMSSTSNMLGSAINASFTCSVGNDMSVKGSNSVGDDIFYTASQPLETGRIASGGDSDQQFTYANMNFNSFCSYTKKWKILPESVKPLEIGDIKVYCTECGAKAKKTSHKFCYNCGTSLK